MMAARGARVILVVDPPAVSLLSGMPGIVACFSKSGATLPAFDMHCPDVQPAAGIRHAARHDSRRDRVPAASRGGAASTPGNNGCAHTKNPAIDCGSAWSGPAIPCTRTITTARYRCACCRGFSMSTRPSSVCKRTRRPDDKATLLERPDIIDLTADLHDFSETAALDQLPRPRDHRRYQRRPPRRRAWPPDLDPAAVHAGLSLAARSRRQPLVSDRAAVPAEREVAITARCSIGCETRYER